MFHPVATQVPPRRVSTSGGNQTYSTKSAISTSVLILHNHPSGDPTPSPEDTELTRRLAAAGVLMGIDVVDHVILGDVRYWSFKEAGRL
jgi:DNA repair protein RadC